MGCRVFSRAEFPALLHRWGTHLNLMVEAYSIRGSMIKGIGRVSNYIVFSVGNGRRIRFWLDSWCGDEALCNSFPSLFALAVSKEEWVAEVWDPSVFNDWEVVLVEWLLLTIQGKRVSAEVEDREIWKKTKVGFSQ